jgi:hypothetical protein
MLKSTANKALENQDWWGGRWNFEGQDVDRGNGDALVDETRTSQRRLSVTNNETMTKRTNKYKIQPQTMYSSEKSIQQQLNREDQVHFVSTSRYVRLAPAILIVSTLLLFYILTFLCNINTQDSA